MLALPIKSNKFNGAWNDFLGLMTTGFELSGLTNLPFTTASFHHRSWMIRKLDEEYHKVCIDLYHHSR